MPVPICPLCRQIIAPDNINVGADTAWCRGCSAEHKLSALIGSDAPGPEVDLQNPPPGTWCINDHRGVAVGASHRSAGRALGLLGIALFWNGIVSVFVLVALGGTLHRLYGAVPAWLPAPKAGGHPMDTGVLVFLWLFLVPFIVIGAGMLVALALSLAGKTEVRIRDGMGSVLVGIGSLGWRRSFDPAKVRTVSLVQGRIRKRGGERSGATEICLGESDGKLTAFGSALPGDRQQFLCSALRRLLR